MLSVVAAGAVIWGLIYGLSVHGDSLWTLVFVLADHLVHPFK